MRSAGIYLCGGGRELVACGSAQTRRRVQLARFPRVVRVRVVLKLRSTPPMYNEWARVDLCWPHMLLSSVLLLSFG